MQKQQKLILVSWRFGFFMLFFTVKNLIVLSDLMLQRALILDVDKSQNTFQHLKRSSLKQQPTALSLMTPVNISTIQIRNLNL